MKKILYSLIVSLMLISCVSCSNDEQLIAEKEDINMELAPYNGCTVRSKTRYNNENICTLQLVKIVDSQRYDYTVSNLPIWVWDEYDLDDTINIVIPNVTEEIPDNTVKEDSTGQKTIVIDGVEYVITEAKQ